MRNLGAEFHTFSDNVLVVLWVLKLQNIALDNGVPSTYIF